MYLSGENFDDITQGFKWDIPEYFNMGVACCDVHAAKSPKKTALLRWQPGKPPIEHSYSDLMTASNRFEIGRASCRERV